MQDAGTPIHLDGRARRPLRRYPCPAPATGRWDFDDPDSVWFIDRGTVDLFLVERKDGVEQAAAQHLLRRDAGTLLPGVAPDERDDSETGATLGLVAKGLPGTLLKRLPASLLSEVHPAELAEQADTWLTDISDTLSRFVSRTAASDRELAEPGVVRTLGPSTLSVRRGVVWVSGPPRGASLFMDMIDQAELAETSGRHEAVIPLTRTSWLTLFDGAVPSRAGRPKRWRRKAPCCRHSRRFTRPPSPLSA